MVKTGGSRRRCKTAIFDKSNMPASCLLRPLPRDVSRCFSYACHRCKGELNLHSDQGNLHLCMRALLQSAAGSVCTRNKNAPSQRRAAVTIIRAALNTRVIQSVERLPFCDVSDSCTLAQSFLYFAHTLGRATGQSLAPSILPSPFSMLLTSTDKPANLCTCVLWTSNQPTIRSSGSFFGACYSAWGCTATC